MNNFVFYLSVSNYLSLFNEHYREKRNLPIDNNLIIYFIFSENKIKVDIGDKENFNYFSQGLSVWPYKASFPFHYLTYEDEVSALNIILQKNVYDKIKIRYEKRLKYEKDKIQYLNEIDAYSDDVDF